MSCQQPNFPLLLLFPQSNMIIASVFAFSSLTLIIRIACQPCLVFALDPISRFARSRLRPHHWNDSSAAGSPSFPGFGHIVTSQEDVDATDQEEDTDFKEDDESDILALNSTDLSSRFDLPNIHMGSTRADGCSCSSESLSCECFGESVREVPKNLTKFIKRM